jgi:hypothetical protein
VFLHLFRRSFLFTVLGYLLGLRSKGCGPDGVSAWVYRDFAYFLSPVLTILFNRSLQEGVFASSLKMANVTPIPKSERPLSASQFRPISILPILSKVFEKII